MNREEALAGIRLAILGAWPDWADPTGGHLADRPKGATLSPIQITAIRAFRAANPRDCAPRYEPYAPRDRLQVAKPRRVIARVAMRLLRMQINARDLLRQLDAANARLATPLTTAEVRDVAIWAAATRRSARHDR